MGPAVSRSSILKTLREEKTPWDLIVIGGGATGLGTALDSASRGFKTLLIEQADFSQGTSSKSTKLIHGGLRYLSQGHFSLVRSALRERGYLSANAPHLVRKQPFIIPGYRFWERPYYGLGLKLYDLLSGRLNLGRSRILSAARVHEEIPTLAGTLTGGVQYYDGQFDDSRLAIHLARSLFEAGGIAVNYLKATRIQKKDGYAAGVEGQDQESGEIFQLQARVIVNATGAFTDSIRRMDQPGTPPVIQVSQGVHLILDRSFLPGKNALLIPKTTDGRVLFAIPWYNKVIIGTTDTPVDSVSLEPEAGEVEIRFLLDHAGKYLTGKPGPEDVRSVFTGLRPLVRKNGQNRETRKISRDHAIRVEKSGLITITGGKWTTYRKMAEDTVDQAIRTSGLEKKACVTKNLKIHGWVASSDLHSPYSWYGSDADIIHRIEKEQQGWDQPMHPDLACTPAQIVFAARFEMARSVEDVLSRRTRSLLLHAIASVNISEQVAKLLAGELGYGEKWIETEVENFRQIARSYILNPRLLPG